jgi:hypothetical protein
MQLLGYACRIVVSVHSCWLVRVREIRYAYSSPARHVEQHAAETMPHTHLLVITVRHGQMMGP